MKYDQYLSLIKRLELFAAERRRAYEFRVLLLTVLGYAYFVGLIVFLVVPIPIAIATLFVMPEQIVRLALLTAKLWWAVLPIVGLYFSFLGSAVKSITAKVPDPPGNDLTRAEAPDLFRFVDQTCRTLKSRRPSRIIITDEFNAAVATLPRFGIFGQKVLLIVGLPLMNALSPDQFKAAIAHEIGHISGKHGGFTKWAYQMREAWGRLIESQNATNHKFAFLYREFVNWFFPFFTAYSFVLMREHEKEADRDAAELAGLQPLGESLILLETKGRQLNEGFWREVHEENLASETPSEKLFSRMLDSLAQSVPAQSRAALAKAIEVPTDFNDTHPSLAERLRLIGYWADGDMPRFPDQTEATAATYFLNDQGRAAAAEFDTMWDEQAAKEWHKRHAHFKESQKRIEQLSSCTDDLSRDEILELAQRQAEKDGLEASMPFIMKAAERFPDDPLVLYNMGGVRLSLDDESGLRDLERAVELDKTFKLAASDLAFSYLRGKGRLDEARRYAVAVDEQNELMEKAKRERLDVLAGDVFEKHDLQEDFLRSIPAILTGFEEIEALYLVHKTVRYMPEYPFRVLFIDVRKKTKLKNRNDLDPSELLKLVVKRIDSEQIHYYATLTGSLKGIKHDIDKIPGARFWSKEAAGTTDEFR